MNHPDCRCETLIRSEIGHVTVCQGCAQVHLVLHCMTLRFEADAFRVLAQMLGQAQHRIDHAVATKAVIDAGAVSIH